VWDHLPFAASGQAVTRPHEEGEKRGNETPLPGNVSNQTPANSLPASPSSLIASFFARSKVCSPFCCCLLFPLHRCLSALHRANCLFARGRACWALYLSHVRDVLRMLSREPVHKGPLDNHTVVNMEYICATLIKELLTAVQWSEKCP